jgi:glycosyltransferase involved in cell wall biosynthesis
MIPHLSIIVPVYNVPESYYRACLQSLAVQQCNDVEFIIINDGSSFAHCESIAKEYVEKDDRFRYYSQANSGASLARNFGIAVARGQYLMFVDGDDTITPECCEYVMRDVMAGEYDCVIYRYVVVRDLGVVVETDNSNTRRILSPAEIRSLIFDSMGRTTAEYAKQNINIDAPWAKIFRKDIIQQFDIKFNPKLLRSEDALFCMEFYQNCKSILLDDHTLYHYTINSDSVCRKPSDVVVKSLPAIYEAFSLFAEKYYSANTMCQTQISYLVRQYVYDAEYHYFLRKQSGKSNLVIAKEYHKFLMATYLNQCLKLLQANKTISPRERLNMFIRTSVCCFPYLLYRRLRMFK